MVKNLQPQRLVKMKTTGYDYYLRELTLESEHRVLLAGDWP